MRRRMPGRVQEGEVAARRVGEQIDAFQAEVRAECLDVADLSVAAVGRRVGRDAGVAGAPQVEQDQPAVPRQPAEIAEVGGGAHRPTGQAEQRLALAPYVVGELGPVRCGEGRHDAMLTTARRSRQAVYARRIPWLPGLRPIRPQHMFTSTPARVSFASGSPRVHLRLLPSGDGPSLIVPQFH